MKKLLPILVLSVFVAAQSCNNTTPAFDADTETSKIDNVLDQYIIASENRDFSIIEKIWSNNEDILLIGTDSDEKLEGWDAIKPAIQHQFKAFDEVYITDRDRMVSLGPDGTIAWFYLELSYNFIYKGEAKSFEGIRFPGVLANTENCHWKIVQGHLSLPAEVDIARN